MATPKRIDTKAIEFLSTETPESAYWWGFMMADGCYGEPLRGTPFLSVGVAVKDQDHLQKLSDSTDLPLVFYPNHGYPQARWITYSNLYTELAPRWGIVHRKTYNWSEPQVPDHLLPHYLRGWFDGDGCVSHARSKWTLVGHPEAIRWYAHQLLKLGVPLPSTYTLPSHAKRIGASSRSHMKKLIKALLANQGFIQMERKWERASNHIAGVKCEAY